MAFNEYSEDDIKSRIAIDNPWWQDGKVDPFYSELPPRPYLRLLFPLILIKDPVRAVVLMGPRRVGKTVILHHIIQELIKGQNDPRGIIYASVDTPIYTRLPLEKILMLAIDVAGKTIKEALYVIFDEIQYLKDWEIHLKSLVDTYKNIKFIVSGSAAAALRLKSIESGAGRFTDFVLPPLSFFEFIELSGHAKSLALREKDHFFIPKDRKTLTTLNKIFEEYINYGGYPELLQAGEIKKNIERYIKSDIIEKVLLKDLPGLYGIQDIQELNALFTSLAYNTGKETSLESLSKSSNVAKNTIKRYIDYLQAAFLIRIFRRIDFNSKKFKRDNFFKIYLVNSAMRGALFSPMKSDNPEFGHLVETAIFTQWFHSDDPNKYYARWRDGEVDLVYINPKFKPTWAVEIKWSNRVLPEIKGLISYCLNNSISRALVTTVDLYGQKDIEGINVDFLPASVYAYSVGRNIIELKSIFA